MLRARQVRASDGLPSLGRHVSAIVLLMALAGAASAEPIAAEPGQSPTSSHDPDRTPISWPSRAARRPDGTRDSESPGSSGWWLGSAGIALILAACGGVSIAARRYLPRSSTPLLQVVGRVGLSPKHSVYLLRVDGRILLVGAGPQGAPSYLGEMPDTSPGAEEQSGSLSVNGTLTSSQVGPSSSKNRPVGTGSVIRNGRLDVRLGDEA
jgi:hypothetical protein